MSTSILLKSLSIAAAGAVVVALGVSKPAGANTLWYNGDFDFNYGIYNVENNGIGNGYVYDNFTVSAGEVWNIDSIWSNNLMDRIGVTQATWSIRTGVSAGNGGTVVASGTSAATQTYTGNSVPGYNEYKIGVSGLNINLDPGTYWLSVTPIAFGNSEFWFNSSTSGSGAVGTPSGNDGNSFFDSPVFDINFDSISTLLEVDLDFSMGVGGTAKPIPEPASVLGLLAIGALGAGSTLKRKFQQKG
jgi:PEP-CTERM motif